MAQIDIINERLEDYTEEAEAIKEKIQEVAEDKEIEIESGDTPLSVLNKINNLNVFTKKYVTQIIDGDKCSLEINSIGNEQDAKMVGQINGKIYIVEV